MADVFSPGPMGLLEKKLPMIGQAVAGAIATLVGGDNPMVFFLLVIDGTTGKLAFTSDGEPEAMRAALAEFLSHHAH
jgi:hypothetical protein